MFVTFQNVAIGLVGEKTTLRVFDEEETGRYLALIEGEERRGIGGGGPSDDPPAPPPGPPAAGEDPQEPQVAVAMDTE